MGQRTIDVFWDETMGCAHLQEERLYIYHNWFNAISYDDCTVGRFVKQTYQP